MARLNAYIIALLRERHAARAKGATRPGRNDILDRILANLEVC
jgi:hypothetical protein